MHPPFEAPGKYLVLTRLDKFITREQPFAGIFFATSDVLSGLLALANYDQAEPHGDTYPMGSAYASIIIYPMEEACAGNPGYIPGMFDVFAYRVYPEKN
jgi:hypothetical protein